MSVVLSPSHGMNFQRRLHGKSNMSHHDIQNDITLRESAYIADQLLKKLTPAQPVLDFREVPPKTSPMIQKPPPAKPVLHHSEVPPIRENRPEAPTAQIPSPKTSPMIQKPAPPQLSSTRARMHFNSLLIPQLKDTSRLGKRKSIRSVSTDDYSTTGPSNPPSLPSNAVDLEPAVMNHPNHRSQTWPSNTPASSSRNNLYIINEENTRDASQSQQQYRQPFPQFPSQRLPPLPPKTSETKSAVEAHYRNYRDHNRQNENAASSRQQSQPPPQQQQRHANAKNPQTTASTSTTHRSTPRDRGNAQGIILNQKLPATGKRRPGQGMTVTVPLIGPPPPGRRNRNRKGKGSANHGGQEGWETVNVHGVRAGRPL